MVLRGASHRLIYHLASKVASSFDDPFPFLFPFPFLPLFPFLPFTVAPNRGTSSCPTHLGAKDNVLELGNCSGMDSEVPSDWLMISHNSYREEGMQYQQYLK